MHQPLAYVHPQAKIARNVVIEPFVTIDKDVTIAEGTWIGPHVNIMRGTKIGKNCKIFPGAVIGAVPQDLKFDGEDSTVEIGDNTVIREYVTINRGTKYSQRTMIGKNCLLMAYVHVAHDCIIGDHCILANNSTLAGHIEIGDYAILGGMTAIHQFCKVGSHAFFAGGSLVNKDVPPFVKAARFPLSYVGVNSIGLRRRGYQNPQINRILDIYRVLFVKPYNTSQALQVIEGDLPASPEKDEIMQFISNPIEGLCEALDREMTITVRNLAKRYNRNVIFKDFSAQFEQEKTYAILGPNGSGKSTLLKVLASMTDPDEGEIIYDLPQIKKDHVYQTIGYVAPYVDIPEEYTFPELLAFHSKFKAPRLDKNEIIELCGLSRFEDTPIKEYSSGMKQRVKLSLVLFFKNLISIYDEPCSHLDREGFEWYHKHVQNHVKHGLVLIGSNNPEEYRSADVHIDIQSFK